MRTSRANGDVQVSRDKIIGHSESFILFALLSCFSMYYINDNEQDLCEADRNALMIMSANGYKCSYQKLSKEIFDFFASVDGSAMKTNAERLKTIAESVAEFYKNNPQA